jgi:geranylgeranyl reductase family protein
LERFDVIVVGAGTAGCTTAKTATKAGLKVCLIDRKGKEEIGDKVCGDAIGKHHFDTLGLDPPKGEELERRIEGIIFYSPDMKEFFHVKGPGVYGFIVNRRLFGQRLLRDAVNAGSTLLDSVQALEPIVKNGCIIGVSAREMKTGRKIVLYGKIVVEASGFSATLLKNISPELGINEKVKGEDVVVCYREIRKLKEEIAEPDFLEIYLNQKINPGGYCWIFPEGEKKVNVGLGVGMFNNFPNPKKQLYDSVLTKPLFEGSMLMDGGGGHVPTRRPLDCMTANGIVIVGDAACQANPIHGGGIGPSMIAGVHAGETIVEALGKGDVSQEALWPYNIKYMQSYGAKQAGLDVFRLFIQGLGDDDLNYAMKYRLMTEDDLLKASMGGEFHLNITEKAHRAFKGLRKLSLLMELRHAAKLLEKVKAWYLNYPSSPKGFEEWKMGTQILFKEAEMRFGQKQRMIRAKFT